MTAPLRPRRAVTLRELAAKDIDHLVRIENDASPSPWSRKLFEGELLGTTAQRLWLVAIQEDQVVGFAGAMFVEDDVHVMNIAVDRWCQRQGIGAVLLAELLSRSVEAGARNATLEVRAGNDPAIELYRRFRLGPVGVRKAYYDDGEDALILWHHDIHSAGYGEFLARFVEGLRGQT